MPSQNATLAFLAISTDSVHSHLAWKELPPEKDGVSDINFPMIADLDKKISAHYGILSKKKPPCVPLSSLTKKR